MRPTRLRRTLPRLGSTLSLAAFATALAAVFLVGAAPAAAGDVTVTFQGSSLLGLPLLACVSQPSRAALTLTPGTSVKLDNQTGHPAVVYLDGVATDTRLAAGASTTIRLKAGTWSVTLLPDCLLNLHAAGTATVSVSASVGSPTPSRTHASASPKPSTAAPHAARTSTPSPSRSPRAHARTGTHPSRSARPTATSRLSPTASAPPIAYATTGVEGTPRDYLMVLVAAIVAVGAVFALVNTVRARRYHRLL